MKQVSAEELEEILNNSIYKLDYVLELGVLQEPKLCIKPVYKFKRAYVADETIPEFCMIYSEADDPGTIAISYNSNKFADILAEYKNKVCEIIFHGENGEGELCESFYYNGKDIENIQYSDLRLLTLEDKQLAETCDEDEKDDYFNSIFEDYIENIIFWSQDCGIIGAFDKNNNFAGYLAYSEIAENIRDVSYIYVKRDYRRMGYAKKLLQYFKNKNIQENKISYYSYAENDISRVLAESCGFKLCAVRYDINKMVK